MEMNDLLDDDMDYEQIGYQIRDCLTELEEEYKADLSGELMFSSSAVFDRVGNLSGKEDWRLLLRDLEACDSAERFAEIITGKYVGITEAEAGLPDREHVEALVGFLYDYVKYPPEPLYASFMPIPMSDANTPCWLAFVGNSNRIIHMNFGSDLRPLDIFNGTDYIKTDRVLTAIEKHELAKRMTEFLDVWGIHHLERTGDILLYGTALSTREGVELGAISIPMRFTGSSLEPEILNSFILISLSELKIYQYHALTYPDYLQNFISMADDPVCD